MKAFKDMDVTIVGLGLMGGSLALALKGHVKSITAVDIDSITLSRALNREVIDAAATDLADGVKMADLIIAATPVRSIISLIKELAQVKQDGCMVTDLGSTKVSICKAMDKLPPQFEALGGHPLCGSDQSSLTAAQSDMFSGKAFILCPTIRTTDSGRRIVKELISVIGSYPIMMQAEEHDRLLSISSHLPYILSAILMNQAVAAAENEPNLWPITASGFNSMTRLAGSDPSMILDILLTNEPAIVGQLKRFNLELDNLIEYIEEGNESWLFEWLKEVKVSHTGYRSLLNV